MTLEELKDYVPLRRAASFIGTSTFQLLNLCRKGKITCHLHPESGKRIFYMPQLEQYLRDTNGPGFRPMPNRYHLIDE